MSSRHPSAPHPPGAHRAQRDPRRRAPAHEGRRPAPVRDEALLDGLFTYCLSVLCDHDLALAALAEVLAVADRRRSRGPALAAERRAWLYALARWACLRGLAEARRRNQGAHAANRRASRSGTRAGAEGGRPAPGGAGPVLDGARAASDGTRPASDGAGEAADGTRPASDGARLAPDGLRPAPGPADESAEAERTDAEPTGTELARRRQLALLAWPEAAGTSPEQREALELSVRHGLTPHEVGAVLGLDRAATRELLASAACEVERTRAALAVVERGTCPSVARLTGDHQLLLGAALRRELVRHVDDCPRCRRTAERAAPGGWPGTSVDPALPVVAAPRDELRALRAHAPGARARAGAPRFDRRGFPMDPKDRAARRDRLRARALTSTVVAAVAAAPVFALWAAYRGAPLTGEAGRGPSISAGERGGPGSGADVPAGYENAGNASSPAGGTVPPFARDRSSDVSVEVISEGASPSESERGPGRLTVRAHPGAGITLITLRASGGAPVHWSASPSAGWLLLSRTSGTLAPGASETLRVTVDRSREPSGRWRATVTLAPSGALVSIEGYGRSRPTPPAPPRPPTRPPHSSTPPHTPTPTRPAPRPTSPPSSPRPSDTPSPSSSPRPSDTPSPSGSPTPSVSDTTSGRPTDSASPSEGSPSG